LEGWKIGKISTLPPFHEAINEILDNPDLANLTHTRCLRAEQHHPHADYRPAGSLGADANCVGGNSRQYARDGNSHTFS
jgi:hypothetical protein